MIIAIDAASTDLSLALAEPDGTTIGEESWTSPQRQSAELLPRLLALLDRHGRQLAGAGAFAIGTGPGSFTGLRVGMALAKGLAVSFGRPVVGIPSLPAWLAAEPGAIAAVARAGAREAYVLERGADAPRIAGVDDLGAMRGTALVAARELAAAFGLDRARSPGAAAAIARLAVARLADDPAGDDASTLEPIYLRPPRGLPDDAVGAVKWL